MNKDPNQGIKLHIEMLQKKIQLKTTSSKYKAVYTKQIKDMCIKYNIPMSEKLNE